MVPSQGLQNHLCCIKLAPELKNHIEFENKDTSVTNIETGVVISINKSSHGSVANATRAILEESFGNLFLPYVCNRVLKETSPKTGLAIALLYGNGYRTIVQRDRKDDDTSTVNPLKQIFVHLRISGIRTTEKERYISSLEVLSPGEDLYEHVAFHAERKDNNIGSDGVSSILWICTGDPLFYYPRKPEHESLIGISVAADVGGYWTRGFCDPKYRRYTNGSLLQKKSSGNKKRSSPEAELDDPRNETKKTKKKIKKTAVEGNTITAAPAVPPTPTVLAPAPRSLTKSAEKENEKKTKTKKPEHPRVVVGTTAPIAISSTQLVFEEDRKYATPFLFALFQQVQIVHLLESDRVQRRADNPLGMAGFACIHCIKEKKEKGSTGRYFPMARKRLADFNHSLRVYEHIMKIPQTPQHIKDMLKTLREKHSDDLVAMKKSQKKFFENIFVRLRANDLSSAPVAAIQQMTLAKIEATPKKKPTLSKEDKVKEKKKLAAEAEDVIKAGVSIMDGKMSSLVTSKDKSCATRYAFYVLSQMKICHAQKDDLYSYRKDNKLHEGFAGLACQWDDSLSGRFFLPKVECLEQDATGIMCFHSYLQQCKKCPQEIKDALDALREHHPKEQENLDQETWKKFVTRLWARLRAKDEQTV